MTNPHRSLPSGIVAKASGFFNVDPRKITRREGWNTRFDFGDLESLANGIESTLLLDPDSPYNNPIQIRRIAPSDPRAATFDFELIDGERRFGATEILLARGVEFPKGVNAKLVDRTRTDMQNTILMFTANNSKPMLPLEEAAAYKRLRDGETEPVVVPGMTIAQIAKAVGRDEVHVRETLELLEADSELQDAVKAGKVAGSTAKLIATVAKGDKELQKDLTKEATIAKGKTTDAKAAKARLMKKLQDKRDAKAKAKGKEVKMRALTDEQLSEMGAKMAKSLEAAMKEAGLKFGTLEEATAYVAKDEKLVAGFKLGVLLALRAAAGIKVDLDI